VGLFAAPERAVSEPSLPDDPARWPTDPHELLGVPHDVNPRDLRRSYTRLIRTYKPEQFPEQFRRIRAAYEAALRVAEFFGAARGLPIEPPAPESPSRERPEVFDPAEDANALWELAAAGHEARAYAGLAGLFRRRPDQADLPLRLYWLLALEPDLEPGRDPSSWLADALRLGRLGGPATELFRRELDERPAEALAAGEALLAVEAQTDHLAAYLSARIAAAAQLRRWELVRSDLDRGRERVRPTDEVSWLRLVLAAIDHLAWAVDDAAVDLLADCRREVESLSHLAVHHSQAFDRVEYLLTAAKGWEALRRDGVVPPELLDLLPAAWVRPFPAVRPLVAELLSQVAAAPHQWLRHLDALAARNPAALGFVGNLLAQHQDRLSEPPPMPHPPADLARLVVDWFAQEGRWAYSTFRVRLLGFCLREAVGPELVAAVAPTMAVGGEPVAPVIDRDWPLRLVCWACRLAWA
jgi:hypothetical protein